MVSINGTEISIGDPCKMLALGLRGLIHKDAKLFVYGRLEEVEGGRAYIRTAGGSLWKGGLMFIKPLENPEDHAQVEYWEEEANKVGQWYERDLEEEWGLKEYCPT